MSAAAVTDVLLRVSSDKTFAEQLSADPATALDAYRDRLTDDEHEWLLGIDPSLVSRFAGVAAPRRGWRDALVPGSFKEAGALVLSAVLAFVFIGMLAATLASLGSDPRGVTIGGVTKEVSEFDRAKDLLNIVVPLFGAAVTFWLGVAIEGRRADENAREKVRERSARADAEHATARATGAMARIGVQAARATGTATRQRGGEVPAARGADDELEKLQRLIDEELGALGQ